MPSISHQTFSISLFQMIKMMITCVTAFTLCWLPFNILSLVIEHFPEILTTDYIGYVYFLCHWLAMSHACYNPIIYCWMNSRYREGFKYVLRWLPCFSARIPDYMVPSNSVATKGIVSRSKCLYTCALTGLALTILEAIIFMRFSHSITQSKLFLI